jgi:hypothetical protein
LPVGPKALPKVVATIGIRLACAIKKSYSFANFLISFFVEYFLNSERVIVSTTLLGISRNPQIFLSLILCGTEINKLTCSFLMSNFCRFIIKSTVWSNFLSLFYLISTKACFNCSFSSIFYLSPIYAPTP